MLLSLRFFLNRRKFMLDSLKEIGIIVNGEADPQLESEDIKLMSWDSVADMESLEEFWGCLELVLAEQPEADMQDKLIEECPCGLILFGQEDQPELLSEKYDGCFVKAPEGDIPSLMQHLSLMAQEALSKGFEEYGQIEDYITRFTGFHSCEKDVPEENDRLLILSGTGIEPGGPEEDDFLEQSKQAYLLSQEKDMEFYSAYSLEGTYGTLLLGAKEKIEG